jgi:light-regulated signal transduction histidine kinase (bacteriophytochrome)
LHAFINGTPLRPRFLTVLHLQHPPLQTYRTGVAFTNRICSLGLAIAKKILELHESEIHVAIEEQAGTCFDFDLRIEARAA